MNHPAPIFDYALIGAGIAGATLAARLATHGRVLLLERESQPGLHSTGRSAAVFMESYGPPQVRALTRASRTAYEAAGVLSPRGALYVAWLGQEALLEETLSTLQSTGVAVTRLDARATLDRVPVLNAEGLLGSIWEPGAMNMDVHALHQQALRSARSAGAQLWLSAEVSGITRPSSGPWHMQCADGRLAQATWLVNAAGAWADTVASLAAASGVRPLGLQPCRRSAFTFDLDLAPAAAPPASHTESTESTAWRAFSNLEAVPALAASRLWPVIAGVDESWYFKPEAGQLLGSPANADPVPAHDVQAEELDIATGIAHIEAFTHLRIRRPRRTWAGLRTFAPDGELVIGADAHQPHFFWLAGQGGYGIQSAAGAALLAEAMIMGAALPPVLHEQGVQVAALAPARFQAS
jgi:D-arginine dehydrogenase